MGVWEWAVSLVRGTTEGEENNYTVADLASFGPYNIMRAARGDKSGPVDGARLPAIGGTKTEERLMALAQLIDASVSNVEKTNIDQDEGLEIWMVLISYPPESWTPELVASCAAAAGAPDTVVEKWAVWAGQVEGQAKRKEETAKQVVEETVDGVIDDTKKTGYGLAVLIGLGTVAAVAIRGKRG